MLAQARLHGNLGALSSVAVLTAASSAQALTQSDGTPIPVINPAVTVCSDNNVQICLDDEEGGHTFDAQTAAAITPETYTPACALTFRVLARGAGYHNTFGWYNVVPGSKPPDSDLHSFLECNDAIGTTKSLDIKSSPFYKGGEIGFFMASPEGASGNCPQFDANGGPVPGTVGYVYYSERGYNPDNTGPNPFIHLITYNSVTYNDSFYFAWEDLLAGGDNDFDDLLTRVSGIQCSGRGEPCGTGFDGKCSFGTMQCRNGVLECVQNEQPGVESCNGIDDDCNGETDEGDLCTGDDICFRGACVPRCSSGEFTCPLGSVCNTTADVCVDPACKTVECPAGQICVQGDCQGPCDGVTCPWGQVCRAGACVDPCVGMQCDTDYVCDTGVCVLKCQCGQCGPNLVCGDGTQRCVPDGCAGVSCDAGHHCAGGACVSDCQGAVCPAGQACESGQCVDVSVDGGATGGGGCSGGGLVQDGGVLQDGGIMPDGGAGTGGASGGHAAGEVTGDSAGNCACSAPGSGTAGAPGLLAAGLAIAMTARRRRRR